MSPPRLDPDAPGRRRHPAPWGRRGDAQLPSPLHAAPLPPPPGTRRVRSVTRLPGTRGWQWGNPRVGGGGDTGPRGRESRRRVPIGVPAVTSPMLPPGCPRRCHRRVPAAVTATSPMSPSRYPRRCRRDVLPPRGPPAAPGTTRREAVAADGGGGHTVTAYGGVPAASPAPHSPGSAPGPRGGGQRAGSGGSAPQPPAAQGLTGGEGGAGAGGGGGRAAGQAGKHFRPNNSRSAPRGGEGNRAGGVGERWARGWKRGGGRGVPAAPRAEDAGRAAAAAAGPRGAPPAPRGSPHARRPPERGGRAAPGAAGTGGFAGGGHWVRRRGGEGHWVPPKGWRAGGRAPRSGVRGYIKPPSPSLPACLPPRCRRSRSGTDGRSCRALCRAARTRTAVGLRGGSPRRVRPADPLAWNPTAGLCGPGGGSGAAGSWG